MSSHSALSIVLGLVLVPAVSSQTVGSTGKVPPAFVERASGPGNDLNCANSIKDQASPKHCIKASSTPTLGMLYPYPGLNNAAPGAFGTVAGGHDNTASGGTSTIAGGRGNIARQTGATVGGGYGNVAGGGHATVAGGFGNLTNDSYAVVAGGHINIATARNATVGGGSFNFAAEAYSTVVGGFCNGVFGMYGTAGGGADCYAGGDWSFAAGRSSKANHDGAFVWGDSFDGDKTSSGADEFNVYASGGVRMFTNSAATVGATLAPGSGTWSLLSDREAKENVAPVDAQTVLNAVVAMPISTWNYKAQDDSIRHMGPMAQDFHAAFGLGVSDKLIDTIDPDGVALAAIQGLNEEVQSLRAENEAMQSELSALKEQIAELLAAAPPSR